MAHCRHQLVPDEELGSLYDLLIDDPPDIRRAIGELVYDHLIAQKFNSSRSSGFFQASLVLCAMFDFVKLSTSVHGNCTFQVMKMILQKFIWEECCKYWESFQLIKYLVYMSLMMFGSTWLPWRYVGLTPWISGLLLMLAGWMLWNSISNQF